MSDLTKKIMDCEDSKENNQVTIGEHIYYCPLIKNMDKYCLYLNRQKKIVEEGISYFECLKDFVRYNQKKWRKR